MTLEHVLHHAGVYDCMCIYYRVISCDTGACTTPCWCDMCIMCIMYTHEQCLCDSHVLKVYTYKA